MILGTYVVMMLKLFIFHHIYTMYPENNSPYPPDIQVSPAFSFLPHRTSPHILPEVRGLYHFQNCIYKNTRYDVFRVLARRLAMSLYMDRLPFSISEMWLDLTPIMTASCAWIKPSRCLAPHRRLSAEATGNVRPGGAPHGGFLEESVPVLAKWLCL